MADEVTYTNSYSMDIIIKICATLTTFLIFLFFAAWHMTRKKYKYPQIVETKVPIENIQDLVRGKFLRDCFQVGCGNNRVVNLSPVSAHVFHNKMAIIVNDLDWLMENKSSFIFTVPFSLAPKSLKGSWKGILFNKESRDKDVLLCLMIKGFESLDWKVLQKSLNFGLRKCKLNDADFSVEISAMLIAFESIFGYEVEEAKLDKKLFFINELAALLSDFSHCFYTGKCLTEDFETKEIIEKLDEILNPVVESAIFHCDSQYHETTTTMVSSPNLLCQIAYLRHHLREDNLSSDSITVDHLSHCLFEHFFVLNELVKDCLLGLRNLASSSPEMIQVVSRELNTEAMTTTTTDGSLGCLHLSEYLLEASDSLVFTKSVGQELIRLLSLGSQFDLSLAERDGQLEEYDMKEYSVIVFNHFAFSRSRFFAVTDLTDCDLFRPGRFVKQDPDSRKYVFFNSGQLVAFQDQFNVVAVPRNFVCRLMLLLLAKYVFTDVYIEEIGESNYFVRPQFELLYDVGRRFRWNSPDLQVN